MDPLSQQPQLILEATDHDLVAKLDEVEQDLPQIEPGWLAPIGVNIRGWNQAGQVDVEIVLQVRVLEQIGHHHIRIGALLHLEHDTNISGRLIPNVINLGDLAGSDQVANSPDQDILLHHVRYRGDNDLWLARPALELIFPPDLHRPMSVTVDRPELSTRVENLPPGGEVGTLDVLHEVGNLQPPLSHQSLARLGDLAEVMRRNVRGHPDRDPRRAIHQQVWNPSGKNYRLAGLAVVVGPEIDGLLRELIEKLDSNLLEPRLRIPIGRR